MAPRQEGLLAVPEAGAVPVWANAMTRVASPVCGWGCCWGAGGSPGWKAPQTAAVPGSTQSMRPRTSSTRAKLPRRGTHATRWTSTSALDATGIEDIGFGYRGLRGRDGQRRERSVAACVAPVPPAAACGVSVCGNGAVDRCQAPVRTARIGLRILGLRVPVRDSSPRAATVPISGALRARRSGTRAACCAATPAVATTSRAAITAGPTRASSDAPPRSSTAPAPPTSRSRRAPRPSGWPGRRARSITVDFTWRCWGPISASSTRSDAWAPTTSGRSRWRRPLRAGLSPPGHGGDSIYPLLADGTPSGGAQVIEGRRSRSWRRIPRADRCSWGEVCDGRGGERDVARSGRPRGNDGVPCDTLEPEFGSAIYTNQGFLVALRDANDGLPSSRTTRRLGGSGAPAGRGHGDPQVTWAGSEARVLYADFSHPGRTS